jgi:hypothetical protein
MTLLIRGRRYVSARAGTYPAPVPPRGASHRSAGVIHHTETLGEVSTEEPTTASDPPGDAALTPAGWAAAPAAEPIEGLFDARPLPEIAVLDEPDLGAFSAAPASPAFAPLTGPLQAAADDAPTALEDGTATFDEPEAEMAAWARSALRRILWGAAAGGALGAVAGFLLLALARGSLASLADPVDLWASIDDTRIKFSATLVAVVCVLVGVALAARRRPDRPA